MSPSGEDARRPVACHYESITPDVLRDAQVVVNVDSVEPVCRAVDRRGGWVGGWVNGWVGGWVSGCVKGENKLPA